MSAKKVADTVKKAASAKTSEPAKTVEVSKESATTSVKAEAVKTAPAKEEKAPVAKEEVKEEKAPVKKAAATKKAAPKAAAKTTKTVKAAKETVSENVYVQFAGKEIKTEELVEQVKAIWTGEGHRASSIKSLEVYVKPDDMAAYYVINGKATGKIEL